MVGQRCWNKCVRLGGRITRVESDDVVLVLYDGCKLERRVHIGDLKVLRHGKNVRV
jgi:hypothetical protein